MAHPSLGSDKENGGGLHSGLEPNSDIQHGGKDHGINVAAVIDENDGHVTKSPEKEDKEVQRIVRKIDLRLLPVLACIYSFALIDRSNLPNARITGMDEALGLSIGNRYTLVVMVFFAPYVIFQFPANILIRKFGAAVWLSSIVVAWGVVCIGIGFNKHWWELLICRVILGTLEAGYFPGSVFLLGCWYLRYEVQKRFSTFYLLALLALGFANIMALGISQMDGLGGVEGWSWIFIIEGAITCLLGLLGYVFIIDFPDKATNPGLLTRKPFLTVSEAKIVLDRINLDRGDAVVDRLTAKEVLFFLQDWKIWEYGWLYLLNNAVSYAFGYYLPIILNDEMGYSVAMSQVLTFPPYALAAPWMFATAWIADRHRKRGLVMVFNCCAATLGIGMLGFAYSSPAARYAGVFLGVAGANSNIPAILSYMHNNIVGQMKRSVASVVTIGCGGLGGIVASNIFREQDAPKYTPALVTVLATQVVTALHVVKNFWLYSRKNRQADRGEVVLEGQEGFRLTL